MRKRFQDGYSINYLELHIFGFQDLLGLDEILELGVPSELSVFVMSR